MSAASADLHKVDTEVEGPSAVAIGSDGLPIIAYTGDEPEELRVAHCADRACSSATVLVLDEATSGGVSMAIGADDRAFVVYHQGGALKSVRCDDIECTEGEFPIWVDPVPDGWIGVETSVAIGADGFPRISYTDTTDHELWFADCQSSICASPARTAVDSSPNVNDEAWDRRFSSIAVGGDDLPLIAFFDADSEPPRLLVAHCSDAGCSSATITPHGIDGHRVGDAASLAIGADGFGVVSYFEAILDEADPYYVLRVLHCLDAACTAASSEVVEALPSAFLVETDIAVGTDGRPLVSYWDFASGWLKLARCVDAACTDARVSVLATGIVTGANVSLAIDDLGQPVVSFATSEGHELWVAYPGIHSDGFEGGGLAAWDVSP